ncbi:MAG: hypothetical protein KIG78_02240, partial [Bacteroidaceae bacterium]|nr:hypothetical protein [Bacteroidaceae bacterium]
MPYRTFPFAAAKLRRFFQSTKSFAHFFEKNSKMRVVNVKNSKISAVLRARITFFCTFASDYGKVQLRYGKSLCHDPWTEGRTGMD